MLRTHAVPINRLMHFPPINNFYSGCGRTLVTAKSRQGGQLNISFTAEKYATAANKGMVLPTPLSHRVLQVY